jgi:VWFA-related protein
VTRRPGVLISKAAMRSGAALALVTAAVVATSSQGTPPQQPAPPTFRSPVVAVPVDVRVIDNRTGKPVTDLTQQDFTVFEDGVRQDVRLFAVQRFDGAEERPSPGPKPAAPAAAPAGRAAGTPAITPQTTRVFLFVLGSGRLQEPSKGMDATLEFIRTRLRPKDLVAAFAYNRATAFTTDHERVARVIERFRKENDALDRDIRFAMAGLAGVYGSRELPSAIKARIDAIFTDAGSLPVGSTASAGQLPNADRMKKDLRNEQEAIIQSMIDAGRAGPESAGAAGPLPALDWSGFDTFVAQNVQTMRDAGNLYAAIAFMQRIEGEKHLVFVTEYGFQLPRWDDERDLARVAADSRVAIDVLQTGGVVSPLMAGTLRTLSEVSGGMASISECSRPALARLDEATTSSYLLGYYPSNTRWDGAFRSISVKVNRPGVTLAYRRGYNARVALPGFDRFDYAARFRVEGAASYAEDVKDIAVTLAASLAGEGKQTFVVVSAQIDPAALHFDVRNGIFVGQILIAVVPMDSRRAIIGGKYKRQVAHLQYDSETLALVRKIGIPYDARLPVPAETRFIRVIVYDATADRVGTASANVR